MGKPVLAPLLLACAVACAQLVCPGSAATHGRSLHQSLNDLINGVVNQLPSIPGLPNLQDLVNQASRTPVYQGDTRLVVPTRATFNMDCSSVTSAVQQSSVFQSVIRGVIAQQLGISADKVNVTQVACTTDGVTLDLDVLVPSNVPETEVQRVVQQITNNATSLIPSNLLSSFNIRGFNLTTPIKLDNIPAIGDPRQYLPPLNNIPYVPAIWDQATSLALNVFNGTTKVQVPVQLRLPSSCSAVAPSQQDLQSYKESLQQAVASTLGVDVSRISISAVNCSLADSALVDLKVLVDQTTSNKDVANIFIRAKGVVTQLPTNFTSKYFNLPNIAAAGSVGFNWTQDFLRQLTKPAEAFTGPVQQIVPSRVTFTADCSKVVSTTQSSDQFKAAVQFAASIGLNLPLDRVNVTQITCGSINTDISFLQDASTDPSTISSAINQITNNPSAVFPPDLRQLIGATDVSALISLPPGVALPPFPPLSQYLPPAPPKGAASVPAAGLLTILCTIFALLAAIAM